MMNDDDGGGGGDDDDVGDDVGDVGDVDERSCIHSLMHFSARDDFSGIGTKRRSEKQCCWNIAGLDRLASR